VMRAAEALVMRAARSCGLCGWGEGTARRAGSRWHCE